MELSIITKPEKEKLYTQALHLLGMPLRSVHLTDEQMDSFLEMSMNEYEELIYNWLIESQWSSLIGINVDEKSLSRAFITRSLDFETQYTYAYSKIVGLQAGGDNILKKDYFEIKRGQQIYEIPAGREINELLYFSRAELNDSIVDPYLGSFAGLGGLGFGGVGGFAQVGSSGSYFMMPAYDLLLRMQDRNIKNRLIGGDLTYRITAGADGKKYVHLYNVPGGTYDFGSVNNYPRVWYWYYETNDRNQCMVDNKDIVKMPNDIETEQLIWENINTPAKNWVRKYFIAFCKEALGKIYGRFSGDVNIPEANAKIDYLTLVTEAKDEKFKLIEDLNIRLERLRPDKMMERKANEAENLNRSLKFHPMNSPFTAI